MTSNSTKVRSPNPTRLCASTCWSGQPDARNTFQNRCASRNPHCTSKIMPILWLCQYTSCCTHACWRRRMRYRPRLENALCIFASAGTKAGLPGALLRQRQLYSSSCRPLPQGFCHRDGQTSRRRMSSLQVWTLHVTAAVFLFSRAKEFLARLYLTC